MWEIMSPMKWRVCFLYLEIDYPLAVGKTLKWHTSFQVQLRSTFLSFLPYDILNFLHSTLKVLFQIRFNPTNICWKSYAQELMLSYEGYKVSEIRIFLTLKDFVDILVQFICDNSAWNYLFGREKNKNIWHSCQRQSFSNPNVLWTLRTNYQALTQSPKQLHILNNFYNELKFSQRSWNYWVMFSWVL